MVVSAYERARQAGQGAVRTAILDTATRLLVAEGAGSLTVRRIAAEVGCSTKVIYTMFGGKDGLVEALWLEGFARLGQHLARVPEDLEPAAYLEALGWAYREYALAEPEYYRVMFQDAVPGFEPSPEAVSYSKSTLAYAVRAVAACMRAGVLRDGDPAAVADALWMALHGAVSLELARMVDPAQAADRFRLLLATLLDGLRTGR